MNEKPLYIPEPQKCPGLKVYCRRCLSTVFGICRQAGKPISQCRYPDQHRFKIFVYVPGTLLRKTKNIETRDINAAMEEAINFRKQVKEKMKPVQLPIENFNRQRAGNHITLLTAMRKYVRYISNDPELVPVFRRRNRTMRYIMDVEHYLVRFLVCLKMNGHNINVILIDEICLVLK